MTKDEFDELRKLPDKKIQNDLEFISGANPSVFRCEQKIENSLNYEVVVSGTFNELLPSIVFNFRVVGVGAICRYCVNSKLHKDYQTNNKCRTHKHSLQSDTCPNNNIPFALERTDLSVTDFSDVETIWSTICREANIEHLGKLIKR